MAAELIDVAEARDRVLRAAAARGRLEAEPVPLAEAAGRILAGRASATEDVPGFDNSAMDGFAVRSEDTVSTVGAETPVVLRVVDESRAGSPAASAVGAGEAIRISTGAKLPAGADAIARIEEVDERSGPDGSVEVEFDAGLELSPGRDIRRAGEDIRAGTVVLEAGTALGPAELGVLMSLGIDAPECVRRPRLAVICTGDELVGPGEPMIPGGVRNSNAVTVRALAETDPAPAEVVWTQAVPDDAGLIAGAVAAALEDADVVVICGGVSVGPHDHVKSVLAEAGVAEDFWGVALRPGRPTWFGSGGPRPGGSLVFGLPGNPVSAYVTFLLFCRPAIRALSGAQDDPLTITARLATDLPRLPRRDQMVRCGIRPAPEGGWLAEPTGPQGSHVLSSLLGADGLALVAAGPAPAPAGTELEVSLLARPGQA